MDDREHRGVGEPVSLPQLYCAPHVRCAEVSERIVMLDLTAGLYDVTDEVGAAMWTQLTRKPADRDIPGLAEHYGVSPAVVAADLANFAAAQLTAGRLHDRRPHETTVTPRQLPRLRPSGPNAWWERATAERDLRRGFANAYAKRTQPTADTTAPRVDVLRLAQIFRTAEGLYPARAAPLDCLPRSLALTRFLRTAGWPAQHLIGVALYPFEAHAWVELNGTPVNEGLTSLQRFTVIQRA